MLSNLKYFIPAFLFFGFVAVVMASPSTSFQRNLLPEADQTYDLGSTTPALQWKNVYTKNLTISGTCVGCLAASPAWPFTPQSWGNSTTTTLGFLNGFLSTASSTISYLGTGGVASNNGRLYNAATTTFSTGLTYSNGAVTCDTASGSVFGCLSSANWTTFNNKQATLSATWPVTLSGTTLTFGGLSTSTAAVVGNIPYFSSANTFANVATGTISNGTGISVTAGQSVIGSGLTITNTIGYEFPSNATSTLISFNGGLTAYASSTIGAGGQTTGLTISGGATTTGNSYLAGNVGIASTSPSQALAVNGNFWVTGATANGMNYSTIGLPIVNITATPPTAQDTFVVGTSSNSSIMRAAVFTSNYTGAGTASGINGLNAFAAASTSATGNLTAATNGGGLRNLYSVSNKMSGYGVTMMSGVVSAVDVSGTLASSTDAADFQAQSPNITSGDLITNMYGFWARGGAVTGTLTNRYGIYVDDLVGGTNRYGMYQAGTSDLNYFGGNTGIGTTTPASTLSVQGNNYVSGTAFFGSAITATSTLAITGAITSTATAANTFPYASSTALTVSGSAYFPNSGIWNSSGNVGIASTSPDNTLSVNGTLHVTNLGGPVSYSMFGNKFQIAGAANFINGTDILGIGSTSAANLTNMRGMLIEVENNGNGVNTAVQGLNSFAAAGSTGSGNFTTVSGGRYIAYNNTTGYNVTTMQGVTAGITMGGTLSSTTNAYALKAESPLIGAGNVITNYYNLASLGGATTGTITNRYGLYIDDLISGTTRYGIYQAGATDNNVFLGKVGLGTTTPVSQLTVLGDIGTDGAPPVVSLCGTSPAITTGSTDTAGEVTEGTIATGCTITFAVAKARAPFCTVTSEAGLAFTFTESATAMVAVNIGALSSTKLTYHCVQNNL